MNNYHRPNGFGSFSIFSPVLKSLLLINVFVFLTQYFFLNVLTFGGVSLERIFFQIFALSPFESDNFNFWQLISYQFMHADLGHLFFNMFALWMFGSELENEWGGKFFLSYYLLSGIGAGIAQLVLSPILGHGAPTIGASGSVFGILLGFGATYPDRKIFMFPLFIPIPARIFVAIYASIDLVGGIFSSNSGVAHFAHLGGAVTGALILLVISKKSIRNLFSKTKVKPNNSFSNKYINPKEAYKQNSLHFSSFIIDGDLITQKEIDEILDKINASGYQSLSDKEKRILYELSKKMN